MMKNKKGIKLRLILFGLLALGMIIVAIFADKFCPFDPLQQDLNSAYLAPDGVHIMGTDAYGRDMFSRIIMGARISIISTLSLVAIISIVGTIIGLVCGYFGGKIDMLVMRISDMFLAFPGLVFAIAIAAIMGGGVANAVVALALISWPKYARIARSQTLAVKNSTYVTAAVVIGDSHIRIMKNHILPNIWGPILVTAVLDIGTMLMELAGLSFLGLGAQPPVAEWGSMMSTGRSMLQTCPWVVLSPGLAIFISVIIFNLFGDSIRDAFDPKLNN